MQIKSKERKVDHFLNCVLVPSPRPCRMYFLETIGEIIESAWVSGNAIVPFEGGHQFKDLPVLRRRGKQKEKDYKYTVNK